MLTAWAIWTTRNDFIFKGSTPIFTNAGKDSRKSWLFLFIRLLGSFMHGSRIGLRDLDNLFFCEEEI
jgi:hypothetical protein